MNDFDFSSCDCTGNYCCFCYTNIDSQFVGEIAKILHEKGIKIWFDQCIEEGVDQRASISTALSGASSVIVFLSRAFFESDTCYTEISMAQAKKKQRIPVLIENVNIPDDYSYILGSVEYVNQSLSTDPNVIAERLYPIIIRSYEGKNSDIELGYNKMVENVELFLKNGYFDKAYDESERIIHANAQSYLGWWCLLKTLTHGKKLIKCFDSDDAAGKRTDDSRIEEVKNAYLMAVQMPDITPQVKQEIDTYYTEYQKNLEQTKDDIQTINRLYSLYCETHYKYIDYIMQHPTGKFLKHILTVISSIFILVTEYLIMIFWYYSDAYNPKYEYPDMTVKNKVLVSGDPDLCSKYTTYTCISMAVFVILLIVFYFFYTRSRYTSLSIITIAAFGIFSAFILPYLIGFALFYRFHTEPKVKKYSDEIVNSQLNYK